MDNGLLCGSHQRDAINAMAVLETLYAKKKIKQFDFRLEKERLSGLNRIFAPNLNCVESNGGKGVCFWSVERK